LDRHGEASNDRAALHRDGLSADDRTARLPAREYAYGPAKGLPDVKRGALTQALYDQAQKDGWVVISMKNDWKRIFRFDE